MNTKKIAVLEKAIQMLENGFDYKWSDVRRCNCGVVVQACGITDDTEIINATWVSFWAGGWTRRSTGIRDEYRCPVTGLRIGLVQETLVDLGFTGQEIEELEGLSNPDILKKMGRIITNMNSKDELIKYLRAWVSILKEQDAKETPEVKERIVYVSVPTTISEQAKELILS